MKGLQSYATWLKTGDQLRSATLTDPQNIYRGSLNIQSAPLLMQVNSFSEQIPIARTEMALILGELETNHFNEGDLVFDGKSNWLEANAARLTNIQRGGVIERFEIALPARTAALKTRLLDAAQVRAYYESTFYAAAYNEFAFHHYSRADREGARAFIAWLGKPTQETGGEVIRWMSDMVTAHYEAANGLGRPADVMQRLPRIPPSRRATLLEDVAVAIGENQAAIRAAAADLYKQFDSRAREMFEAGTISMRIIRDPMRRDRYIQMATERSPDVGGYSDTAYYRFVIGDRAALRALVDDRSASAANRAAALKYLTELGETDAAFAHRRFEEVIDETADIAALSEYARYLNERGEATIKERVMRRALEKHPRADPIWQAWVASSLANALEREGRYKEGFEVVAPHIEVGSANVMAYAASLLQRLGRTEEANQLGEAVVARYQDARVRSEFAKILWRERRYDAAAALFNPTHENYRVGDAIGNLPDAFVETFVGEKTSDAVDAYNALMSASLDESLLESIPQKALDKKKFDLAFALAERFAEKPSNTRAMMGVLIGYRALKQTKGADVALAWLQTKIPPSAFNKALLDFYAQGEHDLVARYASTVPPEKRGVGTTPAGRVARGPASSSWRPALANTAYRERSTPRFAELTAAGEIPRGPGG